jgi:inosine-uridine nucleoside N-ribohydrolase
VIPPAASKAWIWVNAVQEFSKGKPPAGVFFDSDFSTIDTILAMSVLYGLQGKNDCRVAIVSMSRANLAVAGFADAVERFYKGPAGNFSQVPPIGMRTEGPAGDTSPAFTVPFQKKNADGAAVYKNQVKSEIDTGDPNTLFRNYLEAQYDQNAFWVLGGPATNLAAALAFPGMPELIAAKIKYLVVSAGAFPNGPADNRIRGDIAAARKVFAEWPTPIVACGREVGAGLPFPGASIDKEFAEQVHDNPVADAYRAYRPMPYDAPSWDMAAALYAGRPKEGYFKLSGPGSIIVQNDGLTSFSASAEGKHQYLILDQQQKDRILKTYVELASAKPVPPKRFRPADAADPQKEQKKPAADPEKPPPNE